jgi:hypothetical protein
MSADLPALIARVEALSGLLGRGPFVVQYNNDVGPNDEGFWEWWEVQGVKFRSETIANAFAALLNEASALRARQAQEGET